MSLKRVKTGKITDFSKPLYYLTYFTYFMNKDHLGNFGEMIDFVYDMKIELEKHENEKEGFRPLSYEEVKERCVEDLTRRLQLIKDGDVRTVQKQTVHSANYLMFLNIKAKEKQNE